MVFVNLTLASAQINNGQRLYPVCVGVKGDQVFLRKVPKLHILCLLSCYAAFEIA